MLNPNQIEANYFRLAEQVIDENIHPDVAMSQFQRALVIHALELEGGNQCKTAIRLGVHRNTLGRWLAVLQIDPRDTRRPKAA